MNTYFENTVENGEGGNLPSEEIIYCKDCINFYNIHLCLLDKHWNTRLPQELLRTV